MKFCSNHHFKVNFQEFGMFYGKIEDVIASVELGPEWQRSNSPQACELCFLSYYTLLLIIEGWLEGLINLCLLVMQKVDLTRKHGDSAVCSYSVNCDKT